MYMHVQLWPYKTRTEVTRHIILQVVYPVTIRLGTHDACTYHSMCISTSVQAVVKASSQSNGNGYISTHSISNMSMTTHANLCSAAKTWLVSAKTWYMSHFGFLVVPFYFILGTGTSHSRWCFWLSMHHNMLLQKYVSFGDGHHFRKWLYHNISEMPWWSTNKIFYGKAYLSLNQIAAVNNYYRATAMLSAVYAVVVCLSVCVCVCHTPVLYQNG